MTLMPTPPAAHWSDLPTNSNHPGIPETGINCLGSILNLSSPEGGSGQGMFVPEESGKEKEKPANT